MLIVYQYFVLCVKAIFFKYSACINSDLNTGILVKTLLLKKCFSHLLHLYTTSNMLLARGMSKPCKSQL